MRYSQHNLPFCSIVSFHKCFFKVLMVVQETPASYPLRCDVNTSESMLLISKAMREKVFRPCSRFTIFTIIISIRPCLRKKIPSSYKTRQCRGSTGVLDHHFLFFFFCWLHSGSVVKWWKSRYVVIHTSTLEPSLHYIKTLNQRDKQEIFANILKATSRHFNEIIFNQNYI